MVCLVHECSRRDGYCRQNTIPKWCPLNAFLANSKRSDERQETPGTSAGDCAAETGGGRRVRRLGSRNWILESPG